MTKLLTIEVNHDKRTNEIVYIINVIANDQENILILKDVFEDKAAISGIHCYGVKLNHVQQFCYEPLPSECTSGKLFIRVTDPTIEIPTAIKQIAQIIQCFIL